MRTRIFIISIVFLFSCSKNKESINPLIAPITESIYASGIIKSKNQYEVFSNVTGIINNIFVKAGDTIQKGQVILTIANETQHLNKTNAQLNASYSDYNANVGKLKEAKQLIDFTRSKMQNDLVLFTRQQNLWQKRIGSKFELEQRDLAYQNSKIDYNSAKQKYNDLKRQLDYISSQAKTNLLITKRIEKDYTIKSEIDGILYKFDKSIGEIINPQTPIAIIGDKDRFILEMQVDENDIIKIKKGLTVIVSLDSYKNNVFEALITKINPIMNDRSKTFIVEAEFIKAPPILYPVLTFEANIVLQTKEKALLIPREYIKSDSIVYTKNGVKKVIKTGLRDYQKIEILSGISTTDELIKPEE